jgi:hypothetical protein
VCWLAAWSAASWCPCASHSAAQHVLLLLLTQLLPQPQVQAQLGAPP